MEEIIIWNIITCALLYAGIGVCCIILSKERRGEATFGLLLAVIPWSLAFLLVNSILEMTNPELAQKLMNTTILLLGICFVILSIILIWLILHSKQVKIKKWGAIATIIILFLYTGTLF